MKMCFFRAIGCAAAAAFVSLAPATAWSGEIPAEWVGRYQAKVVSASSGMEGDNVTTFGKQMTQTTISLKTLACAQEFTMNIDRSGAITGRGKLMYVYKGAAANAMTAMAPGGLAVDLKDGKQFRDWNFTGQVSPDGTVEIQGIPDAPMDYFNVNKWEKHRPWSALPPIDKAHMRGPFRMKLASEKGGPPAIRVDQYLALDDALIKRVHYKAYIVRSDENLTPQCQYEVPAPPKCPASEYLKFKGTVSVDGVYTVESSRDLKDIKTGAGPSVTSKVGAGGFSGDSQGNVGVEGDLGLLVGSTQFNPIDGSYSMTVGVGVDTGEIIPGLKLSQKVEIVYDSACGLGVKGTGGIDAGAAGSGVEGVIFFNKGI